MIPKKNHFCWLSGDEFPPLIKHCINTWHQVLPEYEIVLWDTKRFDINSVPWVKEAFEAKKYAFAADYIRLYAVYTEGGIYLDSDVEMLKSFNSILNYKSFIGFEASTGGIEAAIFGTEKGAEWCKTAMDFYKDKHFCVNNNGSVSLNLIAPVIFRDVLQKHYPDFPKISPYQELILQEANILVCPAEYFSPLKYDLDKSRGSEKDVAKRYRNNPRTYCIHRFTATWGIGCPMYIRVWEYIKKRIQETLSSNYHNLAQ